MFKNARLIKVLGGLSVAAGLAAVLAIPAGAANATGNLTVSALVAGKCQVNVSAINFGDYDPLVDHATTALDAEGAVKIACTKGQGATISLSLGANADGTTRRMKHAGGETLNYELYSNAGRTTVWNATNTVARDAAGSKAEQSIEVYGRITAGQNVTTGAYSDTVVITIEY